jgi:hypothetical protein
LEDALDRVKLNDERVLKLWEFAHEAGFEEGYEVGGEDAIEEDGWHEYWIDILLDSMAENLSDLFERNKPYDLVRDLATSLYCGHFDDKKQFADTLRDLIEKVEQNDDD